ncbi:regucalcin [Parasteatoda tepidariorum]|uniref:regucalcin n=1 Tax=Parasteatoda tepidariorum TaxID=114398 RepID=UPI0039BCB48F
MSVSRVSKKRFVLGEGPHWDNRSQRLYFVDIDAGETCRLNPSTGETEIVVHSEGIIGFAIPYQSDPSNLLISSTQEIKKLNFDTGYTEFLTKVNYKNPKFRFNDGKCDAKGRLWSGTMITGVVGTLHKEGHLFKMDNTYKMTQVDEGISLSNGLTWNCSNDTMYYIDSDCRTIYAYDFNLEEGVISNKRILIDCNKEKGFENIAGLPDGMTIDTENKIWVCFSGGGCVLRIDPTTKTILRRVDLPVVKVTSCCFGGPNLDILYVTTAARTEEVRKTNPEAGAIFAVTDHGCRGLQPYTFNA